MILLTFEPVIVHHQLDDPVIRLSKLGPRLYVEVDVTVRAEVTIEQQHEVRLDLERRLADLPYDVWLTLEMLPRDVES